MPDKSSPSPTKEGVSPPHYTFSLGGIPHDDVGSDSSLISIHNARRLVESCDSSMHSDGNVENYVIIAKSRKKMDLRRLKNAVYRLVESKAFMLFITLCILANTAFLASDRWPISQEELTMIEQANLVFF